MFLLDVVYLVWNALICLSSLIWMTLKTLLTMNFYHSQNHGPGKVKETWVVEAFGLFISYCVLGLQRTDGVFGDSQNHNLQTHVSVGMFSGH